MPSSGIAGATVLRCFFGGAGVVLVSAANASDVTPLVPIGTRLGEVEVAHVVLHPEYHRYTLVYPDGFRLPTDISAPDPEHPGLCPHAGLTVFPRPDLADGPLPEGWSAPMDGLCNALANRAPDVLALGVPPESTPPPRSASQAANLVWALTLAAAALLIVSAPRGLERREVLGLYAAAWLTRWFRSPEGIFNGANAGYEKLLQALGLEHSPYGPGYPTLYAWAEPEVQTIFSLNRAYNSLAIPLLYLLVRRADGRVAGLAAALGLMLLPVHLEISASELMHGPLLSLSLAALLGVNVAADSEVSVMRRGAGAALTAGAGGLAVLIRPDAAALLPILAFAAGRSGLAWMGTLLATACLALRPAVDLASQDVLRPGMFSVENLLQSLVPRLERGDVPLVWLVLVVGLTPVAVPILAAYGAWGRGQLRRSLVPLAWIACFSIPFVVKSWPIADLVRLQLAAQAGWLWLAGRGVAAWVDQRSIGRKSGATALGLGLWVLALLPWAGAARLGWVNHQEWRFLAREVPALPPDTSVVYDPETPRSVKLATLMERIGPARWRPLESSAPGPDELLFRGVDCSASPADRCAELLESCAAEAVVHQQVAGRSDLDLKLPERVELGFYKLVCP